MGIRDFLTSEKSGPELDSRAFSSLFVRFLDSRLRVVSGAASEILPNWKFFTAARSR